MKKNIYIPVEKMSLKQYRQGLKKGLWDGKEDPKIVKIIKKLPDNPLMKTPD